MLLGPVGDVCIEEKNLCAKCMKEPPLKSAPRHEMSMSGSVRAGVPSVRRGPLARVPATSDSADLVLRPPLLTEEQLKRQREEEEARSAPGGVHGNIKPRKQARQRSAVWLVCRADPLSVERCPRFARLSTRLSTRASLCGASDDECPQVASWLSRPQSASAGLSGCTSPREGVVTRSQSSAQSTPRHRGDDDLQGGDDSDAMDAEAEAD